MFDQEILIDPPDRQASLPLLEQLQEQANRDEACEIFRRLGIKIGLTFGHHKFGPKRMAQRLKGGAVVYGDAEFPEAARPTPATDVAKNTITGPQPANPLARALLATVDPDARKETGKSLDGRQAVNTTSTASSCTPGAKTAGCLTKKKTFGRAKSSRAISFPLTVTSSQSWRTCQPVSEVCPRRVGRL